MELKSVCVELSTIDKSTQTDPEENEENMVIHFKKRCCICEDIIKYDHNAILCSHNGEDATIYDKDACVCCIKCYISKTYY